MKNINSDIAYEFLRKRILSGEYRPGQALMTNLLAPKIGVSRTPIRDALRQLEAEGLVSIQPRLGASVKKMDLKTFRESCELRLALESHAAGLAARNRTPVDLHEIGLALEAMRRATDAVLEPKSSPSVLQELVREDVRFHLAIITAAKNELIKREILRLHLVNRVVSSPSTANGTLAVTDRAGEEAHRREVLACHEDIFRAVEAGDATAARATMEHHIQDIIDRNLHQLARTSSGIMTREISDDEAIYNA